MCVCVCVCVPFSFLNINVPGNAERIGFTSTRFLFQIKFITNIDNNQ